MVYSWVPDFTFFKDLVAFSSINGTYGILAAILVLLIAISITREMHYFKVVMFPIAIMIGTLGVKVPLYLTIPTALVYSFTVISPKFLGVAYTGLSDTFKTVGEATALAGHQAGYIYKTGDIIGSRKASLITRSAMKEGNNPDIMKENMLTRFAKIGSLTADEVNEAFTMKKNLSENDKQTYFNAMKDGDLETMRKIAFQDTELLPRNEISMFMNRNGKMTQSLQNIANRNSQTFTEMRKIAMNKKTNDIRVLNMKFEALKQKIIGGRTEITQDQMERMLQNIEDKKDKAVQMVLNGMGDGMEELKKS